MAIIVSGAIEAEEMLLKIDSNTKRRALGAIIEGAKQIQELAIKMAPIDHGNLEEAIKIEGAEGGAARDAETGRFTRKEVTIYVDGDMPIPDRPGKTVGDYAYEIHEHLEPKGPWQLGERSQEKQDGSDVVVGGGYLERALDALKDKIINEVAIATRG
jgi:hypothetical protein